MTVGKQILTGQVACTGFALGRACILKPFKPKIPYSKISTQNVELEVSRFEQAITKSRQQMEAFLKYTQLSGDLETIFEAQFLTLEDPMLIGESKEKIRLRHINAEWALEGELHNIRDFLLKSENIIFRERADDLEDVGNRILRNLIGIPQGEYFDHNFSQYKGPLVVISNKISPSMFLQLPLDRVTGLVDQSGGLTSHLAILAQSHNLPTLMQVEGVLEAVKDKSTVFLYADHKNDGKLITNPDQKEQNAYKKYIIEKARNYALVVKSPVHPAEGGQVEIWVNIDKIESTMDERIQDLSGVGLFRTEFLYLKDPRLFAATQEHRLAYTSILKNLKPKPIRFRLLDVGQDKPLPRQILAKQKELRGIHFLLANRNLLISQLESILVAVGEVEYPDDQCSILLPMISCLEEVLAIKEILQEVHTELETRTFRSLPRTSIGVMIETPAAVEIADVLANHVDFFCIGSNDLMVLNVGASRDIDRDRDELIYHPALYRQIQKITKIPKIHTCLCGDIAAQVKLLPLILGLGVHSLSIPLPAAANCAKVIKESKRRKNQNIARKALVAQTSQELRELL